jgi:5-methylcytosine-specific restriction endonuclease McrA
MVGICTVCNKEGKLHIHHRDFNHNNNVVSNLQSLCPRCHRQIHIPQTLLRNQARRTPIIDKSKAGWSRGMTWQQILDTRQVSILEEVYGNNN